MASSYSPSVDLRNQGNCFFQRYKISTNYQDQKCNLEKALNYYYRADETSANDDEKASAAKNYATSATKLVSVLEEINATDSLIGHYAGEAVKYFSKGTYHGKKANKSTEWLHNFDETYTSYVMEILESIRQLEHENVDNEICKIYERLVNNMTHDEPQLLLCYFELCDDMYASGITALGEYDYKNALRYFMDCNRPVEDMKRLAHICNDPYYTAEASVKAEELILALTWAEGLQAIETGCVILHQGLMDEETIMMDFVFDAMDLFRFAAIKGRESEIEIEAMAMSKLGSLYNRVLRMKSKAREYYEQAIRLALSLHPRVFTAEEWFVECQQVLEQYRQESILQEQNKRFNEKQEAKRQLEKELKDISDADVGVNPIDFIKYIYNTYPPKNPAHKMRSDTSDTNKNWKKALTTAILHYHPDKQDEDKYGLNWVVLCEEITKRFIGRFERMKEWPTEEQNSTEEKDQAEEEENEDEDEDFEEEDEEEENSEYKDTDYDDDDDYEDEILEEDETEAYEKDDI